MSRRKQARPIRVQENENITINSEHNKGDLSKGELIMGNAVDDVNNDCKYQVHPIESGKWGFLFLNNFPKV